MSKRTSLLLPLLGLLTAASLAANVFLLRRSLHLLRRWREVLLDPLGLRAYAAGALQPEPPRDSRLVVFFGDSRAASWEPPAVPGFTFVNRGINGESSAQALGRISPHLAGLKPDIVVLQVGVNDLWSSLYFPEQRQAITAGALHNLERIVQELQQLPAQVILVTVFPLGELDPVERLMGWQSVQADITTLNAALQPLAGGNLHLLDSAAVLAGPDGYVLPEYSLDALHINSAGYAALNQALTRMLQELP